MDVEPGLLAELDQVNVQTREAVQDLVRTAREVLADVGPDAALVFLTSMLIDVDKVVPGRMCTMAAQALLLLAQAEDGA